MNPGAQEHTGVITMTPAQFSEALKGLEAMAQSGGMTKDQMAACYEERAEELDDEA